MTGALLHPSAFRLSTSVFVPAFEHLEDDFETEAAALQEAHLARAVRGAARRLDAELPAPHLARRFLLAGLESGQRGRNRFLGYPFLAQIALDPPRPVTRTASMHQLLNHTVLGHPAAPLEIVEHALDFGRVLGVDGELARQLGPRMLPPREQLQRPRAQAFSHYMKG